MPQRPDLEARHRRRREATRQRLMESTRELVEELPWRHVSVELIAERAGLARSGFYKHFPDKPALLFALIEELGTELAAVPASWQEAEHGDPRERLRNAVRMLVETFHRHGRLVRALADEAAGNEELAGRYSQLGASLADAVAERIARDNATGLSAIGDPGEVATALIWMNERFLLVRFGQRPLGDPERAAAALSEIWIRTLYGSG
ncbi:MAG TPA: TetR/AcrR family transcriptional regulator [Thermoleophilaceae bacterium]